MNNKINMRRAEFRKSILDDIENMQTYALSVSPEVGKPYWGDYEEPTYYRITLVDDSNKEKLVNTITAFRDKLVSKEGAQFMPRGLYREFLEFKNTCVEFMRWADGNKSVSCLRGYPGFKEEDTPIGEFSAAQRTFEKQCLDLFERLCLYENERDESEESFFGEPDAAEEVAEADTAEAKKIE